LLKVLTIIWLLGLHQNKSLQGLWRALAGRGV